MTKRVLVDLNVVLDVLLDREPHVASSSALWAAIERGEVEGLLSAHCVTTLHYLASRTRDRAFADRSLAAVLSVFSVAAVDQDVVAEALAMGWGDFEDAVCAAAARASGCRVIATRDPRGFQGSTCPALTPAEALVLLRGPPSAR